MNLQGNATVATDPLFFSHARFVVQEVRRKSQQQDTGRDAPKPRWIAPAAVAVLLIPFILWRLHIV